MSNKKYQYYYPENVELAKCLEHGDLKRIARISKYSEETINKVFTGKRKMPSIVRTVYNKIISQKQELNVLIDQQ